MKDGPPKHQKTYKVSGERGKKGSLARDFNSSWGRLRALRNFGEKNFSLWGQLEFRLIKTTAFSHGGGERINEIPQDTRSRSALKQKARCEELFLVWFVDIREFTASYSPRAAHSRRDSAQRGQQFQAFLQKKEPPPRKTGGSGLYLFINANSSLGEATAAFLIEKKWVLKNCREMSGGFLKLGVRFVNEHEAGI